MTTAAAAAFLLERSTQATKWKEKKAHLHVLSAAAAAEKKEMSRLFRPNDLFPAYSVTLDDAAEGTREEGAGRSRGRMREAQRSADDDDAAAAAPAKMDGRYTVRNPMARRFSPAAVA